MLEKAASLQHKSIGFAVLADDPQAISGDVVDEEFLDGFDVVKLNGEVEVAVLEIGEAENKLLFPKLQGAGQLVVAIPEVGGVGVERGGLDLFHAFKDSCGKLLMVVK